MWLDQIVAIFCLIESLRALYCDGRIVSLAIGESPNERVSFASNTRSVSGGEKPSKGKDRPMLRNRNGICLGVLFSLVFSTSSLMADVTIFASSGSDLFRITGGTIEQFDLGIGIGAMDFDDSGILWAAGEGQLLNIADPFGTPSTVHISNITPAGSLNWVGQTLYATESDGGTLERLLTTLDPITGVSTPVGATGKTNARIGGIAADEAAGIMYAFDGFANLLTLDWLLQNGPDPEATVIGSLGLPIGGGGGLDFFEPTGTLYGGIALGGNPLGIFTIDTDTGLATEIVNLDSYSPTTNPFSIAVIPEPGTLIMFAAMGAFVLKRKR